MTAYLITRYAKLLTEAREEYHTWLTYTLAKAPGSLQYFLLQSATGTKFLAFRLLVSHAEHI